MHIIYNTEFKVHWKLAVMLLIMEAYAEYTLTTGNRHTKKFDKEVSLDSFRAEDTLFYKIVGKCIVRK